MSSAQLGRLFWRTSTKSKWKISNFQDFHRNYWSHDYYFLFSNRPTNLTCKPFLPPQQKIKNNRYGITQSETVLACIKISTVVAHEIKLKLWYWIRWCEYRRQDINCLLFPLYVMYVYLNYHVSSSQQELNDSLWNGLHNIDAWIHKWIQGSLGASWSSRIYFLGHYLIQVSI